ncbi:hypothetical protein CBM2629_A50005 [Cupriavidus taiwanensis]|nr:hypothetical protein CBM2629_A50005 [Cupriavidus taiwanensis]
MARGHASRWRRPRRRGRCSGWPRGCARCGIGWTSTAPMHSANARGYGRCAGESAGAGSQPGCDAKATGKVAFCLSAARGHLLYKDAAPRRPGSAPLIYVNVNVIQSIRPDPGAQPARWQPSRHRTAPAHAAVAAKTRHGGDNDRPFRCP